MPIVPGTVIRLDLFGLTNTFYEIKPDTDNGIKDGKKQIQFYQGLGQFQTPPLLGEPVGFPTYFIVNTYLSGPEFITTRGYTDKVTKVDGLALYKWFDLPNTFSDSFSLADLLDALHRANAALRQQQQPVPLPEPEPEPVVAAFPDTTTGMYSTGVGGC